ncbi:MAG: IS200/IS605 family transposase [Ignavibacteriales bacterium]|nr:IS200/IS605 family transposase [Ignavibacteriales bacterium]
MPYISILVHAVWSTKNRAPLLNNKIREIVFNHIKENAKQKDIYLLEINGYIEHVHSLISLGKEQNISKIIQLLKGESSNWINKENLCNGKFEWQDEYFAVSIGKSQEINVKNYIRNQFLHHRKKSFAEEYEEFMDKYGFNYLG